MTWISVKDELPRYRHEVLFFAVNHIGTKEIMIGHLDEQGWCHCCLFYASSHLRDDLVTVTHWMELPNYPKENNDES